MFQNDCALCRLMVRSENRHDAVRSRGVEKLGTFRLHRVLTILFMAVIWYSAAWAQTEPGQTVASIPGKDGELLVQNGGNNDVWLVLRRHCGSQVGSRKVRWATTAAPAR